jgi:diacylglycerol O-acyltransferase
MAVTDRLGSLDATFLELEEANEAAHMHIGAVMVFEALADGPPPIGELRAEVGRRLELLPRYGCRLSADRLGALRVGALRRPTWEPDPDFAVEDHVHRAALATPGGERELMDWCGEYWSTRIDRSRPLWDAVLLEGLEGGRWAIATKTHHALIDGVGSVDVTHLLLNSSRARSRRPTPHGRPSSAEHDGPGLSDRIGNLIGEGARLVSHPARILAEARAGAELLLREELLAAPRTSLNAPIGAHRRYAVARARLSDLKAIKNALGGTVNDVVLAVAAGGLRRLLEERGEELPEQGLRAMVPVNIRTDDDHMQPGNRVSSLFVHLPICEPEPLRRYLMTAGEAEEMKAGSQSRGGADLVALAGLAPPLLHSVLARSTFGTRLFNLTITNVPGPQRPLYAFGAKLEEVLPLVPLAADHAVGIAVVSYSGRVFFGISGDARTAHDLDVLRDGIEAELAELRRIARRKSRTERAAAS